MDHHTMALMAELSTLFCLIKVTKVENSKQKFLLTFLSQDMHFKILLMIDFAGRLSSISKLLKVSLA